MIRVEISRENNRVSEINVSGHAGFADPGEDIVCAAVSVLTISILNGLTEIVGRKDLAEMIDEGSVNFRIPEAVDQELVKNTDLLVSTFLLGIKGVEEAYGDYIEVQEIEA